MSSITVNIGVFGGGNYYLGAGSFQQLGESFNTAKLATVNLSDELDRLQMMIDTASTAENISEAVDCTKNAQKREEEKVEAISKAYNKLEEFVADIGAVDILVSVTVDLRKDDFYKEYSFLKPDNEKDWLEKFSDWCDSAAEWLSENYESFIAVVVCVIVVVVLVVVTICTFGTAGLVAIALYAGIAVANQLISDAMNGELSSWQTYVGAIAGGMVEGCLEVFGLEALSGPLGAGFTTFFTQNLENITGGEQRSSIAILLNTGVDTGMEFLDFGEMFGFGGFDFDYGKMKGSDVLDFFMDGIGDNLVNDMFGIESMAGDDFEVGKLFDQLTGGVSYTDIFNFTADLFTGNDSSKKPDFNINADIEINMNIDFNINISIPDVMTNIVTNGFTIDMGAYAY